MLGTIGPGSEGCDEEGNVAFGGMKVLDPGTPGRGGGLVNEAGGRCLQHATTLFLVGSIMRHKQARWFREMLLSRLMG